MNWKTEAEEKLTDYPFVKRSMKNLDKEIRRLDMELTALRSSGFVSASGGRGGRRKEDRMLDNIASRELMTKALEQAELYIQTVDQALETLDSENREILEAVYIQSQWGSVSELAMELGLERSTLYRKRDDALRKFTLAMYGQC